MSVIASEEKPCPMEGPRLAKTESRNDKQNGYTMDLKGSIQVKDLNFYYGAIHMLKNISMTVEPHQIVAMIGPSGCGKSTLIRVFNRMNDLIPSTRVEGEVLVDGMDIYDKNVDVVSLRRKVGMVFQKSTPFPEVYL